MEILDPKLRSRWKNYLWQGAIAGFSIILILLVLGNVLDLVLIAAVGSTAFVVFSVPHSKTASTRNVVGGHSLCIIAGILGHYMPNTMFGGGLAVALGFFLMVTTNSEHPPAAGTALALSEGHLFRGAIFVFVAALIFSGLRYILLPRLKDLAG